MSLLARSDTDSFALMGAVAWPVTPGALSESNIEGGGGRTVLQVLTIPPRPKISIVLFSVSPACARSSAVSQFVNQLLQSVQLLISCWRSPQSQAQSE